MEKKKDLTFKRLRQQNRKRLGEIHDCGEWEYPEWVMATCGELGELANILKKVRRGSKQLDKETLKEIRHEIADTLIYLDLLAYNLGVDLGKCVAEKFNLVSDKYNSKIYL